jgi:hypothetical protein
MAGQPPHSELPIRTGEFYIQVWPRSQAPWDWHLRVQVVETGEWGECDSIQEAVWIMRQHLRVDADVELALVPEEGEDLEDEGRLEEPARPQSIELG